MASKAGGSEQRVALVTGGFPLRCCLPATCLLQQCITDRMLRLLAACNTTCLPPPLPCRRCRPAAGATGITGRHCVDALLRHEGWQVVTVTRRDLQGLSKEEAGRVTQVSGARCLKGAAKRLMLQKSA